MKNLATAIALTILGTWFPKNPVILASIGTFLLTMTSFKLASDSGLLQFKRRKEKDEEMASSEISQATEMKWQHSSPASGETSSTCTSSSSRREDS